MDIAPIVNGQSNGEENGKIMKIRFMTVYGDYPEKNEVL